MTLAAVEQPAIDAVLGAGERRYFGGGYRRVQHAVSELRSDHEAGTASALARLEYPGDWSAKAGSALRPHLSSIDALVLGAAVCEAELAGAGLPRRLLERAWLRSVTIRAGSAPDEDLGAVAVTARRIARSPGTLLAELTEYDVRAGSMKLRFGIEHDTGLGTAAGPASGDGRPYLDGHKRRRQEISDLDVDIAAGRIAARIAVSADGGPVEPVLEGFYQPVCTMADVIVVAAQLAQVYLYGLDGVPRSRSRTMWLREVSLSSTTPYQPVTRPFPASIEVLKNSLVPVGPDVYRTCEATLRVHGIRGRFKVAHALPVDHPRRLEPTRRPR